MNRTRCVSARCFLRARRLISATYPAAPGLAGKPSMTGSVFRRSHSFWPSRPESSTSAVRTAASHQCGTAAASSAEQGPALGIGLVRKGLIHGGQGEFGGIFRRDRPLSMIHRSGLQDVSYREGAAGQYSGLRSSRRGRTGTGGTGRSICRHRDAWSTVSSRTPVGVEPVSVVCLTGKSLPDGKILGSTSEDRPR